MRRNTYIVISVWFYHLDAELNSCRRTRTSHMQTTPPFKLRGDRADKKDQKKSIRSEEEKKKSPKILFHGKNFIFKHVQIVKQIMQIITILWYYVCPERIHEENENKMNEENEKKNGIV